MATYTELRVHGVSGTPPRDMLYTDPVTESAPDDYTKIYRVPGADEGYDAGVQAFHWGGLTAGNWHTAFWIFLAPFAFANTAGWLIWKRNRGTVVFVRLAGLALTALFSSQALAAAVVIHGWLHLEGLTGWQLRLITFCLLFAILALVFWIAGILSTQSHFAPLSLGCRLKLLLWPSPSWLQPPESSTPCSIGKEPDWSDPAIPTPGESGPWAADRRLWLPHAILHRIRRPHFAIGFAVIAVGVARALDLSGWVVWSGLAMIGFSALVLVLTTIVPERRWVAMLTAPITPVAVAQALTIVALTVFLDAPGPGEWQGIHETNLAIAIAFGGFCLLALLFGAGKAIGSLAIGAFFGSAMGIAGVTVLERLTGPPADSPFARAITAQSSLANGADWVAVWMLVMVLVLLCVASILSFIEVDPEPTTPGGDSTNKRRVLMLLRRVTHRVQFLLWAAVGVGLAAALALALFLCDKDCDPSNLQVEHWGVVGWLLMFTAVLLTAALWRTTRWLRLAIPLSAAALSLAAWLGFLRFQILRVPIDLTRLVDASLAVAVLIPAGLILRSIIGGIGDGEQRRKTGLLWDVASFWPRHFHPLGPPAYGPNAVQELRNEVVDKSLTLTAHSQGSMIATIALGQMKDEEITGLKQLVTYGSPLQLIYGHIFIQAGFGELLSTRSGHPSLPWHNLWRRSDFLGGLPLPLPDQANVNFEADGVGHSGYECTRQFRQITMGLRPIVPPDDAATCGSRPL